MANQLVDVRVKEDCITIRKDLKLTLSQITWIGASGIYDWQMRRDEDASKHSEDEFGEPGNHAFTVKDMGSEIVDYAESILKLKLTPDQSDKLFIHALEWIRQNHSDKLLQDEATSSLAFIALRRLGGFN